MGAARAAVESKLTVPVTAAEDGDAGGDTGVALLAATAQTQPEPPSGVEALRLQLFAVREKLAAARGDAPLELSALHVGEELALSAEDTLLAEALELNLAALVARIDAERRAAPGTV